MSNLSRWLYTLGVGETVQVSRKGDFVSALAATGVFQVSFDDEAPSDFASGLSYRSTQTFEKLRITNTSGAVNTVELFIGMGDVRDARLSLTGDLRVFELGHEVFGTGAPVACLTANTTLLSAANANRRELLLMNESAGKVYIGGASGALAGEGLPLDVGASMTLQTQAAVYARNDSGVTVDIAVAEMRSV